eukprot:TRINITY_DN4076_c0_g1_i1.p1 TRINITY_DN4076_c0_g1~~TRINITY_DN4076_c0_g1_i1.p1  ORF type:complete len:1384 (-),score=338.29 TRINITY_DN4076_c0_g1_i1:49-3903(-)
MGAALMCIGKAEAANEGDSESGGGGGSHAGQGSSCSTLDLPRTYGSPTNPTTYGSAGGVDRERALGGGRIFVYATRVNISGSVDVRGAAATADSYGGASGGSIQIHASRLMGSGVVTASGGPGKGANGAGGGGGRIMLNVTTYVGEIQLQAFGGSSGCQEYGGAGTVYDVQSQTLFVSNNNVRAGKATPLALMPDLRNLVLQRRALVVPTGTALSATASIILSGQSEILCDTTVSLSLGAPSLQVLQRSEVLCSSVVVNTTNFVLDSSSVVEADVVLFLSLSIVIEGAVLASTRVESRSSSFLVASNGQITAAFVSIHSPDIQVFGRLTQSTVTCQTVSNTTAKISPYLEKESEFIEKVAILSRRREHHLRKLTGKTPPVVAFADALPIISPKNSLGVFQVPAVYAGQGIHLSAENQVILGNSGYLVGGVISIATERLNVSGVLTTSGKACTSDTGTGRGLTEPNIQSAGGGAGHAGMGGNGYNGEYVGIGGMMYDSLTAPILTGSGGGSFVGYLGGSGGGVVFLDAHDIFVGQYGRILSDGASGKATSGAGGGGGGSGGTVVITTHSLTGTGKISVVGGDGGSPGGGGGSGGVIRLNWLNDSQSTYIDAISEKCIFLAGGQSGSAADAAKGSNGYLSSVSCRPGYEGVFCTPCEPGFWKNKTGNGMCEQCQNAPKNGYYTEMAETTEMCTYLCPSGYRQPDCLNDLEIFVDSIGGSIVAVAIAWGFAVAVGCVFVVWRQYVNKQLRLNSKNEPQRSALSDEVGENTMGVSLLAQQQKTEHEQQESTIFSYPEVEEEEEKGGYSIVSSDLERHLVRLYFGGRNTSKHPLRLQDIPNDSPLLSGIQLSEFRIFVHLCLECVKWSAAEHYLIQTLKFICYPLALAVQNIRRKIHYKRLWEFVTNKYDHSFLISMRARTLHNALKLSISADFALCYLDVLEYDTVHSTNIGQPRLPLALVFVGDGKYLSRFQLDNEDPLVQSAAALLKDVDGPRLWTVFVRGLNERLRSVCGQGGTTRPWGSQNVKNQSGFLPFSLDKSGAYAYIQFFNTAHFRQHGFVCHLARFRLSPDDSDQALGLVFSRLQDSEQSVSIPYQAEILVPYSALDRSGRTSLKPEAAETLETSKPWSRAVDRARYWLSGKLFIRNTPIPRYGTAGLLDAALFLLAVADMFVVTMMVLELWAAGTGYFLAALLVQPFGLPLPPILAIASLLPLEKARSIDLRRKCGLFILQSAAGNTVVALLLFVALGNTLGMLYAVLAYLEKVAFAQTLNFGIAYHEHAAALYRGS